MSSSNITADEHFVVIWRNGSIVYRFPTAEFTETELDYIREKKFCTGCIRLPFDGFNDKQKTNWCDFSRKLAALEEIPEYVVSLSYFRRMHNRVVQLVPIPEY
jgi:hypothetical protein